LDGTERVIPIVRPAGIGEETHMGLCSVAIRGNAAFGELDPGHAVLRGIQVSLVRRRFKDFKPPAMTSTIRTKRGNREPVRECERHGGFSGTRPVHLEKPLLFDGLRKISRRRGGGGGGGGGGAGLPA